MKIRFNINYHTVPGQSLFVSGSCKKLGKWQVEKALKMDYSENGNWTLETSLTENTTYKYFLKDEHNHIIWEWDMPRSLQITQYKKPLIALFDSWLAPSKEEKILYSAAFHKAILKGNPGLKGKFSKAKKILEFSINAPRISENYQLCILGNQKALGNWDRSKALLMECANDFPNWKASVNLNTIKFPLQYKYGIHDASSGEVISIEEGLNREWTTVDIEADECKLIKSDQSFHYPEGNWKGAGVSVPVFSLRTEDSFGIGEFKDLIAFIVWAKEVGLKMVQILPVNETIASHSWLDSYPYKSISVMALHPIYLNLEKMGLLDNWKLQSEFNSKQGLLNLKDHVDYPEVLKWKSKYYKLLFDQEKERFFKTKSFKKFFKNNKEWLIPYAAFAYLRDKNKTPDFRTWKKNSQYNQDKIAKLCSPESKSWDDIAIHYFIQYHLDKQLKEVTEYARNNGIVLKGDIPIGISPNSVEAWTEPHLFNLNAQAGAPPDDFAIKGQNWGFPTYNWQNLEKENYKWWIERLQKMGEYFDAYRIDHILGFFRIWEIPLDAVEGLLGYFNPCLPLSISEIEQKGIYFDEERYTKPFITNQLLHVIFGEYSDEVKLTFLDNQRGDRYCLKPAFKTQKKVNAYFLDGIEEEALNEKSIIIRNGLFDLIANVLFIKLGEDEFHPRVTFHNTYSYASLDDHTKHTLNELYIDFYYKRHNEYWYWKGLEKLPHIIKASDMLVCGEDLGMVPDCVPPVMDQLNILSLEIQRMPKNPEIEFAHPADAPYLSVCTTSTHDMSTIRGWWEENKEKIQKFHNHVLGNGGQAPFFAEPWVCEQILVQHMYSPAVWVTLPIQDLIAMDGHLRWDETQEEQINHPSNNRNKWQYRMFQSIEQLKDAKELNQKLKAIIKASGRNSDY